MPVPMPSWLPLHRAAAGLLDVLTRLSQALKKRDDVVGQQVYRELVGAFEEFRQVSYPMELALRTRLPTIPRAEGLIGAVLVTVINGAADAMVALSGFQPKGSSNHTENLNRFYQSLAQLVELSRPFAAKEVESN